MDKNLKEAYEALEDASHYVAESYLHINLTKEEEKNLAILNASTAYLYSRFIMDVTPDESFTTYLKEEQGEYFFPREFAYKASELRLRMTSKEFAKKKSHLIEYLEFLMQTEEYIPLFLLDDEGRLAMTYVEACIEILLAHKEEKIEFLQLSEVAFLTLTNTFYLMYKALYGPKFSELDSATFFIEVAEAAERVRGEILD